MPKQKMYCDNCKKAVLHRQSVFQKAYWICRECKEERLLKRSKGDWLDERKTQRKKEEKQKTKDKRGYAKQLLSMQETRL